MGKQQIQDHPPGCMWGLLHMLDYHQWHNLKKRLRCPKTRSFSFGIHEFMESENDHSLQYMATVPTKRSYANERDACKQGKQEQFQQNPIFLLHKEQSRIKPNLAHLDVLEIYRRYPDVGTGGNFHGKSMSAKFTRSGSYPVVADSRFRSCTARTLQHKQHEVWSLPKGNLASSRSIKDYYAASMPYMVDGNLCSAIEQETVYCLSSQLWTKSFRNHLKHIKLRIKNAIKDSKKKNHQPSDKPKSYHGGFECDRRNDTLGSMRRACSINESMECYIWLFDYSFSREAKWHQTKSLKLISEDTHMPINTTKGHLEEKAVDIENKNITDKMTTTSSVHEKDETFLAVQVSVAEISTPNDMISHEEPPHSKDSDINDISTQMAEADRSVDFASITTLNTSQSLNRIDKKQVDDFNYVRNVVELSGFIENQYLDAWHSLDQPLNPSLFNDLETLVHCADEDIADCDHQTLFYLINEALLDVYQIPLSYSPKALSCNSRVRTLPSDKHLVDEIWTRIGKYISFRPEVEGSWDCVVARDLFRGDWMKLQLETDYIALQMEELVFDELLDEIIFYPHC